MIIKKNPKTLERVTKRSFLSEIPGRNGLRIFSAKRAEGARSVPLAVDMIADNSAPKNIT